MHVVVSGISVSTGVHSDIEDDVVSSFQNPVVTSDHGLWQNMSFYIGT